LRAILDDAPIGEACDDRENARLLTSEKFLQHNVEYSTKVARATL